MRCDTRQAPTWRVLQRTRELSRTFRLCLLVYFIATFMVKWVILEQLPYLDFQFGDFGFIFINFMLVHVFKKNV